MNRTRRAVLFGLGVSCGAAIAGGMRRWQETTVEPIVLPEAEPVAAQSVRSRRPAPKGLFAPVRGDVRLAVISDLNSQYGSTQYGSQVLKAVEFLPQWEPDLVLCSGDMVAGQSPSLTKEQIQAMWEAFDRHVAAPIRQAKLPYGFTLGNHDASGALSARNQFLFQQERDLAAAYWNDPSHPTGIQFVDRGRFPFYYTFEQNGIFYLVWDASSNRIPPAQLQWAERTLLGDRAQRARLRIVIGHLPLYAVAVGRAELGEIVSNGDDVRKMLERCRVHTYISGHHHSYYPARKGKLELLHTGALGSGPRPLLDSRLAVTNTLTIVDVDVAKARTTYTTYNMRNLQTIDIKTLPRLIVGPNGFVVRRDLQESDLTPAERNRKFDAGGY
ncbi:MAG: metallophosphoesterase [Oscillatoriales cyanobacterium SM2_1_8]|nr:metallophosphoesterase [Oscillatoriales cyanobacterium SM2_1_8]